MIWTDDPVRDAERYQEALEESPHYVCAECGAYIYEDSDIPYYEIGGKEYCQECVQNALKWA